MMGGGGSQSALSKKTIIRWAKLFNLMKNHRDGKRVTVTEKISLDSNGN